MKKNSSKMYSYKTQIHISLLPAYFGYYLIMPLLVTLGILGIGKILVSEFEFDLLMMGCGFLVISSAINEYTPQIINMYPRIQIQENGIIVFFLKNFRQMAFDIPWKNIEDVEETMFTPGVRNRIAILKLMTPPSVPRTIFHSSFYSYYFPSIVLTEKINDYDELVTLIRNKI